MRVICNLISAKARHTIAISICFFCRIPDETKR